jgi:hypothetical protein
MDTSNSVAHYFSSLEPDDWRKNVGFSPEIESANTCLFQTRSDAEAAAVLGRWLEKWQPCLFGRIAAKSDALTYCFLTENDLRESDEFISTKIQSKRLEWTRHGFEGRKSGFILLAISPMLVSAVPSPAMLELARRLCFLYLQTDIFTDKIHLDQLYLQKPGSALTTWKWLTGVNYFCAQGDRRWWHDHRIPGGMAFSVNSVGHLVKSGIVAKAMKEMDHQLGGAFEDYPEPKVDSLGKALELAMRTIDMAADAVSGKATELLPSPIGMTECPVKLSNKVRDKNCYEYKGFYHTDYTLPSEYFSPDIARPAHITPHVLDFTYLFKRDVDNPDFRLLGEGHQIRDLTNENSLEHANTEDLQMKAAKGEPQEVLIDENERLRVALGTT